MVAFFKQWLHQYGAGAKAHFIVACSGGLDSVVLCEICHQANTSFSIAHCNFGLRGDESDRDEAFVTALGEKYSVPVFVERFDTAAYGLLKKMSAQEAARELRYTWFETLRKQENAAAILLAHHASDNLETVLLAFFRGTGLHGLTGMAGEAPQARCLRPLLNFTRQQLHQFATTHQLQWVEDSSNASSKYTRNFFRNVVIPTVQQKYPQAEANVLHTIERLKKTERLYNQYVHGLLKKLLIQSGASTKVPIRKLLQYADTALPYEVFHRFGFSEKQLPQIMQLANSQSGSFTQNETHRVIKHNKWFLITPHTEMHSSLVVIQEGGIVAQLPQTLLRIATHQNQSKPLETTSEKAQLDLGLITFPLVARPWKAGDYFYPLGMRKKKKVSRFFIDLKIPPPERETIWVLESAKRIIWVVGYRIDDRFKCTETTKTILQLTLEKHAG